MATLEELIEQNKQGLLVGRQKQLFDEAVKQGIIEIPGPDVSRGTAFKRGLVDRTISTVLNIPAGIGELAAQGLATGAAAIAPHGADFSTMRQQHLESGPISVLRNIPRPPEDVASSAFALNDATGIGGGDQLSFADRFQVAKSQREAERQAAQEQFPGTVTGGEVLSDIGAILTGRGPLARARAPAAKAARETALRTAKKQMDELPDHVEDQIQDVLTGRIIPALSRTGSHLGRAGVKATEAGLEGAFLAAINEGDLSTTFGISAGGQAGGSASLFLAEKPIKRLLPAVALAFVAAEMFKAAAPGEQDFFESKDFAIQKAVAALGLGLTASLAGAGRLRGPAAERYPALLDAITAVPRVALISRLQELTNDSDEARQAQAVMTRFASNPGFFTENQQNALSRALFSEKDDAFVIEVRRLALQKDFRSKLAEMGSETDVDRLFNSSPTFPINRSAERN